MSVAQNVTLANGQTFGMDVVRNLMDDEICEQIQADSEQEFLEIYEAAHLAKVGAEFAIN